MYSYTLKRGYNSYVGIIMIWDSKKNLIATINTDNVRGCLKDCGFLN